MENLLTRLVTYKHIDISCLMNRFFNQPFEKLLISSVLLILICGISVYIIFRAASQHRFSDKKDSPINKFDPQFLLNIWIEQNKRFCTNCVDLCVAFLNSYSDIVKLPVGVKNLSFLPHLSSSILYLPTSPSVISENLLTVPISVSAYRLSFCGERYQNQISSPINLSLCDFALEVILNLSFKNTELVAIKAFSARPQFSLLIDTVDPLENVKQDFVCTINDVISNLSLIWKNADDLLSNKNVSSGFDENIKPTLNSDLKTTTEDVYAPVKLQIIGSSSSVSAQQPTANVELDSKFLTLHKLSESVNVHKISTNGHIYTNIASSDDELDNISDVPLEPVVLAHNPSLRKKLNDGINRRTLHQRSASDAAESQTEDSSAVTCDISEPVPLDPIVHPPDEQQQEDQIDVKSPVFTSKNITQRSLKKVTDVSPVHERVSSSLASKNLLVKVVKADFIDLKYSSDAYCVVELDEPYQRHATHVVPPSEQLFWDQHLLFGLNTNSKRAYFEVFELSKRRKSISRGCAEIHLSELLTSSLRGSSTELLRCIPLDLKQHSSSTAAGLLGGGAVKWDHNATPTSSFISLAIRKPTVTAEFHFMERIVDDPFAVCKGRSVIYSPLPLPKVSAASAISTQAISFSSSSSSSSLDSSLNQATTGVVGSSNSGDGSGNQSPQEVSNAEVEGSSQLGFETLKDLTPTPQAESVSTHENLLQRSTSTRGSRLFEPAYENLRSADFNASAAAMGSRHQHHPYRPSGAFSGFRRKSAPRALSTGFSGTATNSGFGLLGPSSQLAGVVAGLTAASVESSTATVDPTTAAAVASAVAVAAATGRSTSASAPLDRRAGGGGPSDSLFEGIGVSTAIQGATEYESVPDAVVRYAAPVANIAESLGTYSAQVPPKRQDATGTKLMSLFKTKKKQIQPSGIARLLYLQNLEGSEFDAISTEGYHRIVHGDQMDKL